MAHRPTGFVRTLFLAACAALMASGSGCSLIATGLWAIDPRDREAEYKGLKGQRVAVVCRAGATAQLEATGSTHEVAQEVAALLKQNVKHIHLVSQKDVDDWVDNNELKSYAELGQAVKADKVVAIEIDRLSIREGKTLYHGQAQVSITVHDMVKGGNIPLRPLQCAYPKTAVSIDIPIAEFRAKFLKVLCSQIGRRFYAYESLAVLREEYYTEETSAGSAW